MKKQILLALSLTLAGIATTYGQVGIGTENPQQLLHIDGKSSEETTNATIGEPTMEQQMDDFVVTKEGRIGLGTINPKGVLELNSTSSGFVPPRMTNDQRDNITIGSRPTGTIIYNTSVSKIQYNAGTDSIPIWVNLESSSSTANTSIIYTKTTEQTINNGTPAFLTFNTNPLFNSTPNGFISMINSSTIKLAGGKTYKIEFNQGFVRGTTSNSSVCTVFVGGVSNSESRFWTGGVYSGPSNSAGYASLTNDANLRIQCATGGGSKIYASGTSYPVLSITIVD